MKESCTILCVDDDEDILMLLKSCFSKTSYNVLAANSGQKALHLAENNHCDIALLDYKMPEMDGLEVLKHLKRENPDICVFMLTKYSDTSLVVKAMKLGASDYILKPLDSEYLLEKIESCLQSCSYKQENIYLKQQLKEKNSFENLIGISTEMQKIFDIIIKVANQDNTVLIQGESGTGKEQIAKAIHYSGKRAKKLFIPVDCGSINPNLIESELFGHLKGAFTGANERKTGLMKAVGDGTLFFDEIGELPLQMQTRLLRALQEMEIRPVGSTKTEKIYARIIAATNKNLLLSVEKQEFRMDLFYRLNVVKYFINKYKSDKRHIEKIDSKAMDLLLKYSWPGNVRELENCIERAFILGTDSVLRSTDLPETITNPDENLYSSFVKPKTLEDYEREAIIKTLAFTNASKKQTARILRISKSTLYNKLEKYSLKT